MSRRVWLIESCGLVVGGLDFFYLVKIVVIEFLNQQGFFQVCYIK